MIPKFPNFKSLEIIDKPEIEILTKQYDPYSDHNFVSLWSYNIGDDLQLSSLNGNIVIRFQDYITNELFYSFYGNNDVTETIKKLLEQAKKDRIIEELRLIPEINFLNYQKPEIFRIDEDRDNFDYIYSTEEISKLLGSKYANKRNKINNFLKKNLKVGTVLLDLDDKNTHKLILSIFSIWKKNKGKKEKDTYHELKAVKKLLKHAKHFELICHGVYIDNYLKGFSVVEIIHNNFAVFHFVKADPSHMGIFEFIYNKTAQELFKRGCLYINREQDLGISGLRIAKESWRPINFLKKYKISYNSNINNP